MSTPAQRAPSARSAPRLRSPVRVFILAGVVSFVSVWGLYYARRSVPLTTHPVMAKLSGEGRRGQRLFNARCASCHGPNGVGSRSGPPLIHPMYRLGHPGAAGIRRAIVRGVPQRHWRFGAMPAQAGIEARDIDAIVVFIQEMQRANKLY